MVFFHSPNMVETCIGPIGNDSFRYLKQKLDGSRPSLDERELVGWDEPWFDEAQHVPIAVLGGFLFTPHLAWLITLDNNLPDYDIICNHDNIMIMNLIFFTTLP